ncbi:uncharacterized protein [Centruroides vittatus]|uniref:uncharacterized protein n=1 Tax=Centruroides vittatus TaxID=120091 RepID=UPI00350F06B0
MKTEKYWAYCYRLYCGLNTNMHIENMHKCIKHTHLQGKRVKCLDQKEDLPKWFQASKQEQERKEDCQREDQRWQEFKEIEEKDLKQEKECEEKRMNMMSYLLNWLRIAGLDKAIQALMTSLRDKMYDRIIIMHKGKVTSKFSDLRKRHKTSLSLCKDLVIKEDNTWKIPSSNGSDIYTVAMVKENCECQIVCNECKSCIHMYMCTCIDSTVKFNMCKHIHLVCQLRAESVSKQCDGQQGELLIWEKNNERKKEVLLDHLSKNKHNDELNTLNNNRKVELKRKNVL